MGELLTPAKLCGFRYKTPGPKIQRLWDSLAPGLGAEVFPSQTRRWIYRYYFQGVQRIITLRPIAGTRAELKEDIDQARVEAGRMRKQIDEGIDPKAVRQARQAAGTVRDLYQRYLETPYFQTRSPDFRKNFQTAITAHLLPVIGDQRPETVRRYQIKAVVDRLIEQGKEGAARGFLAHTRILFNFAQREDLIDQSPAAGVRPMYTTDGRRQLWLETPGQIRAAWHINAPLQVRALVRWALLTGCRRDEARLSTWADIDIERGTWTIRDTKNTLPLVLPVMPAMQAILIELKATFPQTEPLFPGTLNLKEPIPRGTVDYILRVASKSGFSMHVLRHTVESHLAELGIPEEVRDMILNHTRRSTGARYNHSDQLEAKRAALTTWHTKLFDWVNEEIGK